MLLIEVVFLDGSTLIRIGSGSFFGCKNLQRMNKLPEGLKSIGKNAFISCSSPENQACSTTGPPPPFLSRSTKVDACSICGNTLCGPSSSFIPPNPPDGWLPTDPNNDCTMSVALMNCGHKFHLDCVQHTHKFADMCVICEEEADFVKIVKV